MSTATEPEAPKRVRIDSFGRTDYVERPESDAPQAVRQFARQFSAEMIVRLVQAARGRDKRAAVDAAKTVLAHGIGQPASTLQLGEGAVPVLAVIAGIDVTGKREPIDVTPAAAELPEGAEG